jgi:hypothetical protein
MISVRFAIASIAEDEAVGSPVDSATEPDTPGYGALRRFLRTVVLDNDLLQVPLRCERTSNSLAVG